MMSEEKLKLKNYLLVSIGGVLAGIVGTLAIIKWIPEYQEKNARKQGEIITQEIVKILRSYKGAANGE